MSVLQNLLKSLKENVAKLENEIEQQKLGDPQLWDAKTSFPFDDSEQMITWPAFEAIESIRIDARALEAAVTPSRYKLLELGLLPGRTSALNVAVSLGITDAIEEFGGEASIDRIAEKLAVNNHKLGRHAIWGCCRGAAWFSLTPLSATLRSGRIIRTLADDFIYQEISPGVFKNTRHSKSLARTSSAAQFLSLL
jgi:hypothetical protein